MILVSTQRESEAGDYVCTSEHCGTRGEEPGGLQFIDLLTSLQDHGGLCPGEYEVGVLLSPTEDCPHVCGARELEGCHHLWSDCSLQETQRSVLPVSGGCDQLYVGVRGGGVELLGEKCRLTHRDLAAGSDIEETVAHLMTNTTYSQKILRKLKITSNVKALIL